jgi:hypothetical protein
MEPRLQRVHRFSLKAINRGSGSRYNAVLKSPWARCVTLGVWMENQQDPRNARIRQLRARARKLRVAANDMLGGGGAADHDRGGQASEHAGEMLRAGRRATLHLLADCYERLAAHLERQNSDDDRSR